MVHGKKKQNCGVQDLIGVGRDLWRSQAPAQNREHVTDRSGCSGLAELGFGCTQSL